MSGASARKRVVLLAHSRTHKSPTAAARPRKPKIAGRKPSAATRGVMRTLMGWPVLRQILTAPTNPKAKPANMARLPKARPPATAVTAADAFISRHFLFDFENAKHCTPESPCSLFDFRDPSAMISSEKSHIR